MVCCILYSLICLEPARCIKRGAPQLHSNGSIRVQELCLPTWIQHEQNELNMSFFHCERATVWSWLRHGSRGGACLNLPCSVSVWIHQLDSKEIVRISLYASPYEPIIRNLNGRLALGGYDVFSAHASWELGLLFWRCKKPGSICWY
jgi:hypothetical protein